MSSLPETSETATHCCPQCHGAVALGASESAGELPCPHCRSLLWFVEKRLDHEAVVLTFLPGLTSGSESEWRAQEVTSAVGEATRVVLDLSRMRFISSLFLGMLVAVHWRVIDQDKSLRLCGLNPDARRVLKITSLDTIFSISPDEPSALESF